MQQQVVWKFLPGHSSSFNPSLLFITNKLLVTVSNNNFESSRFSLSSSGRHWNRNAFSGSPGSCSAASSQKWCLQPSGIECWDSDVTMTGFSPNLSNLFPSRLTYASYCFWVYRKWRFLGDRQSPHWPVAASIPLSIATSSFTFNFANKSTGNEQHSLKTSCVSQNSKLKIIWRRLKAVTAGQNARNGAAVQCLMSFLVGVVCGGTPPRLADEEGNKKYTVKTITA